MENISDLLISINEISEKIERDEEIKITVENDKLETNNDTNIINQMFETIFFNPLVPKFNILYSPSI